VDFSFTGGKEGVKGTALAAGFRRCEFEADDVCCPRRRMICLGRAWPCEGRGSVTADLTRGQLFGAYHVVEIAGSGGMGIVYRAEQRSLRRTVDPEGSSAGDCRVRVPRAFLREAQLAAAVNHPHVVSVFDVGEQDGRLYLAMQWIDGPDLPAIFDGQQRMAPERSVLIGTHIAAALQAVHDARLVHRDVKPSNVLLRDLDGSEHAYLTDFGVAKMPDGSDNLTRTGWVAGTSGYLSPEQIRGEQGGPRSDLYALGCIVFEALTGQRPFGGANDAAVRWAHASSPRPLASAVCPALGPRYDAFLEKALAVDPDSRFASGRAFATALQSAHAGRTAHPAQSPSARDATQLRPGTPALPDIASAAGPATATTSGPQDPTRMQRASSSPVSTSPGPADSTLAAAAPSPVTPPARWPAARPACRQPSRARRLRPARDSGCVRGVPGVRGSLAGRHQQWHRLAEPPASHARRHRITALSA
jgi:serine/threonine protein kinase